MTTKPNTQLAKANSNLQNIFGTHGYQKEVMADELFRVRKKQAEEYTKEQADKEVSDFLDTDQATIDAAARLEQQRKTPIVSRESQMALLKGMIRDYEKGVRRPGLSAHSVLKAAELLNKMTGYEQPQEIKVEHEHKINVLPIAAEPFRGELEPLNVIDLGDATIVDSGPLQTAPPTPPPEPPTLQPKPPPEPETKPEEPDEEPDSEIIPW